MHPESRTDAPASFWRRLAAMGYDTLLVIPLMMLITAINVAIRAALVSPEAIQQSQSAALTGLGYWLNLLLALSVTAGFFILCWTKGGRTLGMQAWKLRIINEHGGLISHRQALTRLAVASVSAACFGVGYLWMFYDKQQRTWHDIASGSRIILRKE